MKSLLNLKITFLKWNFTQDKADERTEIPCRINIICSRIKALTHSTTNNIELGRYTSNYTKSRRRLERRRLRITIINSLKFLSALDSVPLKGNNYFEAGNGGERLAFSFTRLFIWSTVAFRVSRDENVTGLLHHGLRFKTFPILLLTSRALNSVHGKGKCGFPCL